MKKIVVVGLCILLGGCYSYRCTKLRNTNRQNLNKLRRGMTKEQVMYLMGEERCENFFISAIGQKWIFISATNPYRNEVWQDKDKTLEVLYYYTDVKKNDGAITDDELTPLVFENDALVGWGLQFMETKIGKYEIRIR